jgi:hypothetical protein
MRNTHLHWQQLYRQACLKQLTCSACSSVPPGACPLRPFRQQPEHAPTPSLNFAKQPTLFLHRWQPCCCLAAYLALLRIMPASRTALSSSPAAPVNLQAARETETCGTPNPREQTARQTAAPHLQRLQLCQCLLVPVHGSQHASSLKARQRVAPVNGNGALQTRNSQR